jgi:hypothetical protein
MSGKGVVLGLTFLLMVSQAPIQVEAGMGQQTLTWQCGLQIGVHTENNDFWTTNAISEIYFTLTLLQTGTVVDFKALIFQITLTTETNYSSMITIDNPWNASGDVAKITSQFTILKEDVNNAGWDMYTASFFYNFSILVELNGGDEMKLYTHIYEGTPISVSTLDFMVFWPFPPIILMAIVYWVLYIGLKRFNKRYEGINAKNTKDTDLLE